MGDYVIGVVRSSDNALTIQREHELPTALHRTFNIRDFGAAGDGTTDDANAFDRALSALEGSRAGGTICVPPGSYYLSTDLHLRRTTYLLGGGNSAGNAGVELRFAEGRGIIVHSYATADVIGANAGGSIIQGLRLVGTPVKDVAGGHSLPPRWQANTIYSAGQRVVMVRDFAGDMSGTKIQGIRYFYWECVQTGKSGPTRPDLQHAKFPSYFGSYYASTADFSTEWAPRKQYGVGQVVRRAGFYDWIFVATGVPGSGPGTSGDAPPGWVLSDGGTTNDNGGPSAGGILWTTRPASPYFYIESPTGGALPAIWACRVHAGVRMQLPAIVRSCYFEGFLNAAVAIAADDGWYPWSDAIGWKVEDCGIGSCGTGIVTRGTKAHMGSASGISAGLIGTDGSTALDWSGSDSGGNGGIAFLDLSYYGNNWMSCTNEFSSDRGIALDGVSQVGNPAMGGRTLGSPIGLSGAC